MRVGGTQQLLRFAHIRAAFQQRGRQTRRHFRRQGGGGQFNPADRSGITPQQNAKLVFRLGNLFQDGWRRGRRVRQSSFGAGCFQVRRRAAFEPPCEDFQAFAKRIGRALDDLQLLIQLQQAEVIRGDFAQQAQPDAAPRFLRGQKLCAGGFVEPANAAPQVHFPEGVECGYGGTGGLRVVRESRAEQIVPSAADRAVVLQIGNELRSGLHGGGPGLFHPRHGDSQIIIIRQGFPDQRLQRVVPIDLPPVQIGK